MPDSLRLDKWLWAARFYKTRALAAKEVSGGKVKLNGARTKPAHAIICGDRIEINKNSVAYTVVVQSLSAARGPATKAKTMYEETNESQILRQRNADQFRIASSMQPRVRGRPNKHDRHRLLLQKGKI